MVFSYRFGTILAAGVRQPCPNSTIKTGFLGVAAPQWEMVVVNPLQLRTAPGARTTPTDSFAPAERATANRAIITASQPSAEKLEGSRLNRARYRTAKSRARFDAPSLNHPSAPNTSPSVFRSAPQRTGYPIKCRAALYHRQSTLRTTNLRLDSFVTFVPSHDAHRKSLAPVLFRTAGPRLW
jgi:hypothetical protein